jgi:L-asparaginase
MPSATERVVILGTGGTIAGVADASGVGYRAAQLGVEQLVAAVPALAGLAAAGALECEQLAQVDSKDMTHALWQRLAQRCAQHLARVEVAGVVVTHGSDTLEETAYFLHRVLAPDRPLVLTAAMRPATALHADGPQNLLDAVTLAHSGAAQGWCGVLAVLAGQVWAGAELRKLHAGRLDAFAGGAAGPLGAWVGARLERWRELPATPPLGLAAIAADPAQWPRVEVVASHAGAGPGVVDALCAAGVDGLVVAATGGGTVHAALRPALERARAAGVAVAVVSRCAWGPALDTETRAADWRTPWQARIDLLLQRLAERPGVPPGPWP